MKFARITVVVFGTAVALAVTAAGLITASQPAALAAPPAARAAAHHVQRLAVSRLSFGEHSVDAANGSAEVPLSWTVTDSRAGARQISGSLTLAAPGTKAGTYLTQRVSVSFALKGASQARPSGSPRKSSYTYIFAVPQYALAASVRWQVISLRVRDNKDDRLTLSAAQLRKYKATLQATELVDTTAPAFESLQLVDAADRTYVYSGPDGSGSATAYLCVIPPPDGFASGSLRLTGPGSHELTVNFGTSSASSRNSCASSAATPTGQQFNVAVKFPANSAAGLWTATSVVLSDALGHSSTATDLGTADTLTVTGDRTLSASNFSASPNPVDNWISRQVVTVSMDVTGAVGGVSAIYLDFGDNQYPLPTDCQAGSSTPVTTSDGAESVEFVMQTEAASCVPTGIAVVDGAGDVALYGSEYDAPTTGLDVIQVPDTTPPVATAASLNPTTETLTQANTPAVYLTLTVDVTTPIAPVNYFKLGLYQNGNLVQSEWGGVSEESGVLSISVDTWNMGLTVGTYTIGLMIQDEGGLSSSYGPGGTNPMPGGPITLTITPG